MLSKAEVEKIAHNCGFSVVWRGYGIDILRDGAWFKLEHSGFFIPDVLREHERASSPKPLSELSSDELQKELKSWVEMCRKYDK